MRRVPVLAIAVWAFLSTSGCRSRHTESTPPVESAKPESPAATASATIDTLITRTAGRTRKKPTEPLNVLLITVDSLRADMPWTGYERDIAPRLTEFARQSTVYPRAYSVASYTAKSVASMLTGQYPSSLYRDGWFFTGYSQANTFLSEVLHENGVRSLGMHAHLYFGRGKGLEQGFDVWELVPGITFDAQTDRHVTSPKMTELAIKLLGNPENTGRTFFAWLHYMDPHNQYLKHEESPDFGKKNRDRYDSEVFFTDRHIGLLLDFAKEQPWWNKTVVIVSADHGEAFGEHGIYKHAFDVWEVVTRVPLIIHASGIDPKTIEERRSQIDLGPTILELMGIKEFPKGILGRSLVAELYGLEAPASHEPIVLDLPEDSHNSERRAVISGDYKFIRGRGVLDRLFNLERDPTEEHNLTKTNPVQLKEMLALFEKTWSEIPQVRPYGGNKLTSGRVANGPTGPGAAKPPKQR